MIEPLVINSELFKDSRGFFLETYRKKEKLIANYKFVQDNVSFSKKGVIRGLHYQHKKPQNKYLTVILGKIFDVVVDIRNNSKNFGKVYTYIMTNNKNNQLLIPRGFAHGFQCLSNTVIIHYKCDNYYYPKDQYGIIYNDQNLNIDWPLKKKIVSKKDKKFPLFDLNKSYF